MPDIINAKRLVGRFCILGITEFDYWGYPFFTD